MTGPPPALPQTVGGIVMMAGRAIDDGAVHARLATAAADLGESAGVPVLIASSQAVYGRAKSPVSETDPARPDTDYGRAKAAMEAAVADRPGVTLLRIANVAGCDALLGNAARPGPLTLDEVAPGQGPRRSWIGPASLGAAIRGLLATEIPLPRVLNVAAPGPLRMDALLTAAGLGWTWRRPGPACLPDLTLDVTALSRIVPLDPATPENLLAEARAAGWRAAA